MDLSKQYCWFFNSYDNPESGKHQIRIEEYGILNKKSSYYHDHWVVRFDKGFTATVSFKTLNFVSNNSASYKFVRGEDDKLVLERIDGHKEEQDAILRVIKIQKSIILLDITRLLMII